MKLPGFALLMIFQLVPSQCSARVSQPPRLAALKPTAQMLLAETAAIPRRLLARHGLLVGSGLETMLQLVPSQCSMAAFRSVL